MLLTLTDGGGGGDCLPLPLPLLLPLLSINRLALALGGHLQISGVLGRRGGGDGAVLCGRVAPPAWAEGGGGHRLVLTVARRRWGLVRGAGFTRRQDGGDVNPRQARL